MKINVFCALQLYAGSNTLNGMRGTLVDFCKSSARAAGIGISEMAAFLAQEEQNTVAVAHGAQQKKLSVGKPLNLAKGSTLSLAPHAKKNEIGVLLSGLCWSEWAPAPGRRRILEVYCIDDIVHLSAFPHLPGMRLFAVEATQVLKVRLDDLTGDVMQPCDLAAWLFGCVRKQQRRHTVLVSILGGLQAEERVAALLIELSLRLSKDNGVHHPNIQIPLTRQDIADHLALNADTLSRILSRLKSDGVIQRVGREKTIIKDWPALLDRCPISEALLAEYQPIRKR